MVHQPQVIFTTAYDKYALQAFDSNAIDYLLKPYTAERFQKALAKFAYQSRQGILKVHRVAEKFHPAPYPLRMLQQQNNNQLQNVDEAAVYQIPLFRKYVLC